MPLRTEAICDRCGQHESFGEKQSFPETPPPDWYGLKLTRREDATYAFAWGLLCSACYAGLQEWLSGFDPFAEAELASSEDEAAASEHARGSPRPLRVEAPRCGSRPGPTPPTLFG